jgi:hypothetical protein
MRKLFALFLVATFILGDYTIAHLNASASAARDERADNLLRQARAALGGEAAINAVQNLLLTGTVSHKVKFPDNQERTMNGNVEMAIELPGKLHKKFNIGDGSAAAFASEAGKKMIVKNEDVLVVRRSPENGAVAGAEAPKVRKFEHRAAGASRANDLSALVFGLLAKTSPAIGAAYNYLGEGSVDGRAAEIIEATGGEGGSIKLYLDKQSNLPLMVSYRGVKAAQLFITKKEGDAAAAPGEEKDVVFFRHKLPEGEKAAAAGDGQAKVFVRKKGENGEVTQEVGNAPDFPRVPMEETEIQIRFSDYRSVNGLLLPHRIVETVGGQETDATTVTSYQINAPDLAERFKNEGVRIRVPRTEKLN